LNKNTLNFIIILVDQNEKLRILIIFENSLLKKIKNHVGWDNFDIVVNIELIKHHIRHIVMDFHKITIDWQ
jgi:hypothetical protein